MSDSLGPLNLFFLIAPLIILVSLISGAVFFIKYKKQIYKWNFLLWVSYFIHFNIQGVVGDIDPYQKVLFFSFGAFVVANVFAKFLNSLGLVKYHFYIYLGVFLTGFSTHILLRLLNFSFLVSSLPMIAAAVAPMLFPKLEFLKLEKIRSRGFNQNALLITGILTAFHSLSYSYAGDKPELLFPGYLTALVLVICTSIFNLATIVEYTVYNTQVKEALSKSAIMVSLGSLVAEVAHEIKNPVSAILLNTQHFTRKFNENKKIQSEDIFAFVQKIEQLANRISVIIRGLQNNSRQGDNDDFVKSDIKLIITDTIELLSSRLKMSQVEFNLEINSQTTMIECRPVQLSQVFLNLIQNSIDAIENQNSKRWIKCVISDFTNDKRTSYLKILMQDSGSGIPIDIQDKIFDSLFTTKTNGKGTGLGLNITKRFIESHLGKIYINNSYNHTTFEILLPLSITKLISSNSSDVA